MDDEWERRQTLTICSHRKLRHKWESFEDLSLYGEKIWRMQDFAQFVDESRRSLDFLESSAVREVGRVGHDPLP